MGVGKEAISHYFSRSLYIGAVNRFVGEGFFLGGVLLSRLMAADTDEHSRSTGEYCRRGTWLAGARRRHNRDHYARAPTSKSRTQRPDPSYHKSDILHQLLHRKRTSSLPSSESWEPADSSSLPSPKSQELSNTTSKAKSANRRRRWQVLQPLRADPAGAAVFGV